MVSKQLSLSHGTRFLAVSLMDRFMDRHIVMKYRLKLVALTSLLIAGRIIIVILTVDLHVFFNSFVEGKSVLIQIKQIGKNATYQVGHGPPIIVDPAVCLHYQPVIGS